MIRYWKWLGEGRRACHGGRGTWPLPGTELKVQGEIVPCKNGLHVCRKQDLVSWIDIELWEVRIKGQTVIICEDKVVTDAAELVRKVETWNDKTARLFAADCAKMVLHLFEKQFPDDNRPRKAIEAAQTGTTYGTHAAAAWAARAAAWAARTAAARDVTTAAAHAAYAAANAAAYAAHDTGAITRAARTAAHAARAAATYTTVNMLHEKQTRILLEYMRGKECD